MIGPEIRHEHAEPLRDAASAVGAGSAQGVVAQVRSGTRSRRPTALQLGQSELKLHKAEFHSDPGWASVF